MSRPDRNAILAFLAFWRELSWEDRAIFASTVKPDLTEDEVATLAAVSRRHLYRGERYQAHKLRLADFKEARPRSEFSGKGRGFSNPNRRDRFRNPDPGAGFSRPFGADG
jgi:hypothetical protein